MTPTSSDAMSWVIFWRAQRPASQPSVSLNDRRGDHAQDRSAWKCMAAMNGDSGTENLVSLHLEITYESLSSEEENLSLQ